MSVEHLIRADGGDGVTEIRLNRAPVNALSADFLMDFAEMIEGLTEANLERYGVAVIRLKSHGQIGQKLHDLYVSAPGVSEDEWEWASKPRSARRPAPSGKRSTSRRSRRTK